jgi:hypothetical protein
MEAGTLERPAEVDQNGTEPQEPQAGTELVVDGGSQLSFEVGGKRPTSGTLKFTGKKIEATGSFKKGQRVTLELEAVVNFVGFKDEHDAQTGQVVACQRRQEARITGIRLVGAD